MSGANDAEMALREGDPAAALRLLQEQVRARPADAKLRVFLFQLLCVLGQWERALAQLDLCAQMDAAAIPMRQMYGDAIRCERVRADVFRGMRSPMLFGAPDDWIALLIESLIRAGRGEAPAAQALRAQAFELAPASSGSVGEQRFAWIADADMRLGPVLEAVINGRYYWVPFSRLQHVDCEAPEDLRDQVWLPARLQFANGGEALALIPTRYPGSEADADPLVVLARKTVWDEPAPEVYFGRGQRVLSTDGGDLALLEVRSLNLDCALA